MMKMSKSQRGKGKKDMMVYFSLALIYPHDNVSHLIHNKTENENDHLTQWLLQRVKPKVHFQIIPTITQSNIYWFPMPKHIKINFLHIISDIFIIYFISDFAILPLSLFSTPQNTYFCHMQFFHPCLIFWSWSVFICNISNLILPHTTFIIHHNFPLNAHSNCSNLQGQHTPLKYCLWSCALAISMCFFLSFYLISYFSWFWYLLSTLIVFLSYSKFLTF